MPRLTLAVFLFAASALAQTYAVIDYTKVPSCAKQCTVLTSAESACIPPTQPVTSQNSYQACFCASSSLTGLYASSQAVCSNVCTSTADQQQLANWYVNLCTSGIVVTPAAAVVTVSSTSTGSQTGSAAQATGTGSSSGQSSGSTSGGGSNSWFSNHWKWVLMLIIVFLAMIAAVFLGLWLKRRHRRKVDARGANVAAREDSGNNQPRATAAAVPAGSSDAPASREMSMSGGAAPVAPPRPPRAFPRSRSNTMNSRHSGVAAWNAGNFHPNGSASNLPTAPSPVYAGANDLPERTYSPVVSRRSSGIVNTRPSTMNLDAAAGGQLDTAYEVPDPVSPMEDSITPIATPSPQHPEGVKIGAQRLREMRSQELAGVDASNRSISSRPSSKRLSKKQ